MKLNNLFKRIEIFYKLAQVELSPVQVNADPLFKALSSFIAKAQSFLSEWKKQPKFGLNNKFHDSYKAIYSKLGSYITLLINKENNIKFEINSIKALPSSMEDDEISIADKQEDIETIQVFKSKISSIMQQLKDYAMSTFTGQPEDIA